MATLRIANVDVSYRLTGKGQVTVVITQGLGFASAEWWAVQDRLSTHARVLTWDRPGYGSSGAARSRRSVRNIAVEALQLVDDVAPEGPLVLVGHSQGGLYTNALARIAAARVRGVALLDPAHPDNGRLRRELPPQLFPRSGSDLSIGLRLGRRLARLHALGLFKPLLLKQPPFTFCSQHPSDARNAMWRHLKRPQAYETALSEYAELEFRTSSAELEASGAFPPVPLVVLVHDPEVMIEYFVKRAGLRKPEAERVESLWGSLLAAHAALSPLAKLESVVGSGHLIHLEKPDVAVDWIAALVQAAA